MALVECLSLHKEYRRGQQTTHAVQGVSLAVGEGESIAITGPSGCGKTTLLNMIGLIAAPTSGSLRIAGQSTEHLSGTKIASLRSSFFGYIVQDFALVEDYTALDNVEIPLLYGPERLGHRARTKKAAEALVRVEMEGKSREQARNLSGGQRQRVAIARALVSSPQVILADEPTGSLDSRTGQEIFRLLKGLVQEGTALLLVTHNIALAQQCGREVQMIDGRII